MLLGGAHAYKTKKALKNPFLDQSTLVLREHACREELRLNGRLAPALYLGVVAMAATLAAQMRSAEPLGADEEGPVVRCRPLPQAAVEQRGAPGRLVCATATAGRSAADRDPCGAARRGIVDRLTSLAG